MDIKIIQATESKPRTIKVYEYANCPYVYSAYGFTKKEVLVEFIKRERETFVKASKELDELEKLIGEL